MFTPIRIRSLVSQSLLRLAHCTMKPPESNSSQHAYAIPGSIAIQFACVLTIPKIIVPMLLSPSYLLPKSLACRFLVMLGSFTTKPSSSLLMHT